MAQQYFRLRIRNAADDGDELVITSDPSGTNPYLAGPPEGDGQSFGPLTGESTVGVYTGQIIDADVGATPVVTGILADASGRQQLLSRRAFWEWSTDGAAWNELVGGYVNSLRLISPLVFEVAVGDTRRIAETVKVWGRVSSSFDRATNVIGSPVRGGFFGVIDYGGWRFTVISKVVGETVTLQFKSGFIPDNEGGFTRHTELTATLEDRINQLLRSEWQDTEDADGISVTNGWFPGVNVEVYEEDGTLEGTFQPVGKQVGNRRDNVLTYTGIVSLIWKTSQPNVNDIFVLYGYKTSISQENPLHITGHPIDLETGLFDDLGIAYDNTESAAVKTALGDDLRVALRITEPMPLKDAQKILRGMFGYGARRNASGEEVFFISRLRDRDVPTTEITTADVPRFDEVIFDIDEETIVNVVTVRQHRFLLWDPSLGDTRPADDLVMVAQTRRFEFDHDNSGTPDLAVFGERERLFSLPGMIGRRVTTSGFISFSFFDPVDLDRFGESIAREIFDRYGRGGILGTVEVIGTSIAESLGEEVKLTLPHQVNSNFRGGTRIVQIVHRTEIPTGARLDVVDSGSTSQLATTPTFTLADGTDTRKQLKITITNAATLNTGDASLRIDVAFGGGATPEGGSRLAYFAPGGIPSIYYPEPFDAGASPWIRMRTDQPDRRPGAWTSWANHPLDTLNAPSGLSLSGDDPDSGVITATWTVGANASDIPISVFIRDQSAATPDDDLVARLPSGSSSTQLFPGAGTFTVTVRHIEEPPYGGTSAATAADVTVSGTYTMATPDSLVLVGDGTGDGNFGIQVNSPDRPANIEFDVAVETGYYSDTPGSYTEGATISAGAEDPIEFTDTAPDDQRRRYVRARAVRSGATASGYVTSAGIWPWFPYPAP